MDEFRSIDDGRYTNVSELIIAGFRLLEDDEGKLIALRKAIEVGRDSGRAIHFDPQKHLQTLKAEEKSNG